MPNRAERRAQASAIAGECHSNTTKPKAAHVPACWTSISCRKSHVVCRTALDGPWKPSASTITETENVLNTNPDYKNPKMFKAPHSVRQWFRVASWVLIALSAIAFLVVMWLPSHPMWLISTVAIVFAVGVLSLFFTAGNPKRNPNLDQNGTAV